MGILTKMQSACYVSNRDACEGMDQCECQTTQMRD